WRRDEHTLAAAKIQHAFESFALTVKEGREQDFAAEADRTGGDGNRVSTEIEHHDQRFALCLATIDQEIALRRDRMIVAGNQRRMSLSQGNQALVETQDRELVGLEIDHVLVNVNLRQRQPRSDRREAAEI